MSEQGAKGPLPETTSTTYMSATKISRKGPANDTSLTRLNPTPKHRSKKDSIELPNFKTLKAGSIRTYRKATKIPMLNSSLIISLCLTISVWRIAAMIPRPWHWPLDAVAQSPKKLMGL